MICQLMDGLVCCVFEHMSVNGRFGLLGVLTSLCHSNEHIETMPAWEINPFTALTRIRSQFLRTQWSTSNHQRVDTTTPQSNHSEWTRLRIRQLSHRGWHNDRQAIISEWTRLRLRPLSHRGWHLPDRAALCHSKACSQPMELVCIDVLSLEQSKGTYGNILVMMDVFTKFSWAVETKNQLAVTTANALVEHFFVCLGLPVRIHSDYGRNFTGNVIKQPC